MTLDEQIADDEARARWFVVRRDLKGNIVERYSSTGWSSDVHDLHGRTWYWRWSNESATRAEADGKRRRALRDTSSLPRDPIMFVGDPSLVRFLPAGTRARRLERALRDLIAELPRCRAQWCSELATLGTVSHEPEACAEHWPQYIGGYHGRENGAALAAVDAQKLLLAAEKRRAR